MTHVCEHCGKTFEGRSSARYCCKHCAGKAYNLGRNHSGFTRGDHRDYVGFRVTDYARINKRRREVFRRMGLYD